MKKQAFNPYLPGWEYVPDGEPHVYGERVYVYGSHDRFGGDDFCLNDYVCWSAPTDDLADWRYEGVIYRKTQDPYLPDAASRRMFAPDQVRGADGRYYLYYAFDFTGTIAVAVCDTPAGQYEYYGRVRRPDKTLLGESGKDVFHYDPGVFRDKDGRIFLYTGFCPVGKFARRFTLMTQPFADGGMVTELEEDMLTMKGEPKVAIPNGDHAQGTSFEGHAFFEAPSMRRIRDRYYFIYSSEKGHELCYGISDRPDGGFVYGGTIISNGDIGYKGRTEPLNYTGTNHGSIVEMKGQYYIFYHRQTNGNPYSRQGCAERIEILPDGRIPQAEITSCGLNGGALRGTGAYPAGIACCLMSGSGAAPYRAKQQIPEGHPYITQEGGDREGGPAQYITGLQDGAVAGYRYFETSAIRRVTVWTRGTGEGELRISTGLEEAPAIAVKISPSDGWTETYGEGRLAPGTHALWFRFVGTGKMDFTQFRLEE